MIKLTRLDGSNIYLNKSNIQWIETLPDTTITILSGARIIVREKIDEILKLIDEKIKLDNEHFSSSEKINNDEMGKNLQHMTEN
jgi:flagellar protein FlbD